MRQRSVESAIRNGDGWIDPMARAGFATKGVVYAIVGILAVRAALGTGGSTDGTRGAIIEIAHGPFGQVLLGLTAVGLFAYAVWRFISAWADPDGAGDDLKGVAKRMGYVVSGAIYLGLAVWSASIILGSSSSSGGNSQETWTATLLAQPLGQWLVGLIGAGILVTALYHFYRAYDASFMRRYDRGDMDARQRRWARRIGRFGLAARGVTFGIIGGFLIQAAIQSDASETKGLGEAFQTLAQQPYGPWLLGLVAFGFIAYGMYCISRARYSTFSAR